GRSVCEGARRLRARALRSAGTVPDAAGTSLAASPFAMTKRDKHGTAEGSDDAVRGSGGELHQRAKAIVLTSNQGVPISDDQNSLKIGARGPTLLEDFLFLEKLTHFDHERIPERVVHARGSAAHGSFAPYDVARTYSRAAFLQYPK